MASSSQTTHLVVLVHGMWGNPEHLAEMDRIIRERVEREAETEGRGHVRTFLPQSNKESSTYDGIDWGGERVADEVYEELGRIETEGKKVTKLSVVGYSLGGLIGRYLIGVLYQRKLFDTVTPVNFFTVATPHLGIILYPTFRSRLFSFYGQNLLSRTGEQFFAVDKWSAKGRPLLDVMADPQRVFHQALALFPNVCFYANAVNDTTVPYLTAAVELEDPFMDHEINGITIEFDKEYNPLIESYNLPAIPPPPPSPPKVFSKEWIESYKPRIPLPPRYNKGFPYNILIYASLPLLIPAIIAMISVRLTLDSRSSRGRIKLLESEESYRERLVHVVGQLEKQMEDVVVDFMDSPDAVGEQSAEPAAPSDSSTPSGAQLNTTHAQSSSEVDLEAKQVSRSCSRGKEKAPGKPKAKMTDIQKRVAKNLNSLPNLRKKFAFIHPVMNSHAVIIARDVKRFPHHTQGHGVLRHLADSLVL